MTKQQTRSRAEYLDDLLSNTRISPSNNNDLPSQVRNVVNGKLGLWSEVAFDKHRIERLSEDAEGGENTRTRHTRREVRKRGRVYGLNSAQIELADFIVTWRNVCALGVDWIQLFADLQDNVLSQLFWKRWIWICLAMFCHWHCVWKARALRSSSLERRVVASIRPSLEGLGRCGRPTTRCRKRGPTTESAHLLPTLPVTTTRIEG